MPAFIRGAVLALLLLATAASSRAAESFDWGLPRGYPLPKVPADNPMSVEKVELGRLLFYDTRMSGNETQACATCHRQDLAFTDGLEHAVGSTGQNHPRGSMSLTNVAYSSTLGWGNPLLRHLEDQAPVPMFGDNPVELGLSSFEQLTDRLRVDARYERMFAEAFTDDAPITVQNAVRAIASFVRTLISHNSPYDQFFYEDDANALSNADFRGFDFFFSERGDCFHCHGGFNFADSTSTAGSVFDEVFFHNNGLYNIGGTGAYPPGNRGILEITHDQDDMGRFKAPTLRNIELTAPYMHDGSIATLDEMIDHYAAGGRTITDGPYAGDGSKSPYKEGFVHGFTITAQERSDLLAALKSLSDPVFVTNPKFSDPFPPPSCPSDCNYDGAVTDGELMTSIHIGFDSSPLARCIVADTNGDGAVGGHELIAAVLAAGRDCASGSP